MSRNVPHPSAACEGYYTKFDLKNGSHIVLVICSVRSACDPNRAHMLSLAPVPRAPLPPPPLQSLPRSLPVSNMLPGKPRIIQQIESTVTPAPKKKTTKANTSKPRAQGVASGRVEKKKATTTTATTAEPKTKTVKAKKPLAKAVKDKVEGKVEKVEGAVEGKPAKKVCLLFSFLLFFFFFFFFFFTTCLVGYTGRNGRGGKHCLEMCVCVC